MIIATYDELKEKSEKDSELLKDGKFEQYHEKSMKDMFEMVLTGMDAVVGMLVPKLGGSTEYNQTKIQDTQIAVNKLLVTVGDHEDRLTEIEQNVITKDEMITWTKSMQNAEEGVVVKNAPWAAAIIDMKTPLAKKTALVKEVNELFKTKLTTNDINAVKLSVGGGTKYGDMIQIFFARREAISEVMDYYFRHFYINKKNREIDMAFRKSVGKWERYKSMAEIENGKKFARLKETTYPKILKTCSETWDAERNFKEDIENNLTVIADKIKSFTIPIFNGNKAKNLGAGCITISLPKQQCTKAQKMSYQERFMDAVREARRWEEWNWKQVARQEEEQRQKSRQFAQMLKKNLNQAENDEVVEITEK